MANSLPYNEHRLNYVNKFFKMRVSNPLIDLKCILSGTAEFSTSNLFCSLRPPCSLTTFVFGLQSKVYELLYEAVYPIFYIQKIY